MITRWSQNRKVSNHFEYTFAEKWTRGRDNSKKQPLHTQLNSPVPEVGRSRHAQTIHGPASSNWPLLHNTTSRSLPLISVQKTEVTCWARKGAAQPGIDPQGVVHSPPPPPATSLQALCLFRLWPPPSSRSIAHTKFFCLEAHVPPNLWPRRNSLLREVGGQMEGEAVYRGRW
jgi:hypothetical protein